MNIDNAKQAWQNTDPALSAEWRKNNLAISWTHPALRSMQRQLLFEGLCWMGFLFLIYTGLDGDQRPLGWTLALIGGLLLLIAHALLGYHLASRPVGDLSVTEGLTRQLASVRKFSWVSMALRTATLLILFGFLTSNIPDLWVAERVWAIASIAVWTGVSLYIQYRLWRSKLRRLSANLSELSSEEPVN